MGAVVSRLLEHWKPPAPEPFARLDANRDRVVTFDEFEASRPVDKDDLWNFLAMDRDGDAAVNLDEFEKATPAYKWLFKG